MKYLNHEQKAHKLITHAIENSTTLANAVFAFEQVNHLIKQNTHEENVEAIEEHLA